MRFSYLLFLLLLPGVLFSQDVEDRLVYAWVSNNADFDSTVILNNTSANEAEVTFTARRFNGETETVTRTLGPLSFFRENAGDLFPELGQGPGYTVTVSSAESDLRGRWITFNRTSGSSGSPSQGVASRIDGADGGSGDHVLFGFLPNNPDFFAAPVLVNMSAEPVDARLLAYDSSGMIVWEDTEIGAALPPLTPVAVLIGDRLPKYSGDVQLVASSESAPLTGVSFVFNNAREPAIGNVNPLAALPQQNGFLWNFNNDLQNWQGDFADYPVADAPIYDLEVDYRAIPNGLESGRKVLFLRGDNHSDDLFMYAKRRLTGLEPNASYAVSLDVTIASDSPGGCFGIGGAPGESVFFKAGATTVEPLAEPDNEGWLRMTIDKGNQSQDGADMKLLDHIAVETDCNNPDFLLKRLTNADQPIFLETDDAGSGWLILGTDSGFEGATAVYFTSIRIQVDPVKQ